MTAGRGGITAAVAAAASAILLAGCGLLSSNHTADPGVATAPPAARPSSHASATTSAKPVSQPYNVTSLLDPSSGKFLGLEANGAPDSLAPVTTFAANTGRKPNMIGQYVAWGDPVDTTAAQKAWSYGALYYMAWEPFAASVQSIADGDSDTYITKVAETIRSLNQPVALSFGHEMNGNWYPWGTGGSTPAAFVAAWRHIHTLFAQDGASNVIWVWNPNVINPIPQIQLKPYWPGNAYVNWVGITGYFSTTGPDTYATLYEPTMSEVRKFTSKPFIIAETSIETGPQELSSAQQLAATVSQPDVLGFVWFDYNKAGVDWSVEARPAVRAALASDIANLPLVRPKP